MSEGAFTFGPDRQLIGFSEWPWDELYRPVVGLFVSGRMIAHAFCELERPRFMPPVSTAFAARLRRKLTGVKITPQPIALKGPDTAAWFVMPASDAIAARIRAGDHTVRLARLEDGEPVGWEGTAAHTRPSEPDPASPARAPMTVEALLQLKSAEPSRIGLDGFPVFRDIPFSHQLDITFVELLRRLPDPAARAGYLPDLERGAIDLFDLRRMIMDSDEFRARRIGLQDRIGTLYTSPVWRDLARWPTLEQATRPRRPFSLQAHADLPDADFVAAAYRVFLDRAPDEPGLKHYLQVAATSGRRDVAQELMRWAILRGESFELV